MNAGDFELDKELLDGFLTDSFEIMATLKEDLNSFTFTQDPKAFEQFGQGIDRIMGAALTLGFKNTGELAKLGKDIGYKASQLTGIDQLLTIQSVLSQLLKEMERELKKIKIGETFGSDEISNLLVKLSDINQSLGNLRTSVKVE